MKGRSRSADERAAISRGVHRHNARRRAMAQVALAELALARRAGAVAPQLAGLLECADVEADAIAEGLGGVDQLSPQRLAMVQDFARLGVVLRGELARYLEARDGEAAARVGTLAGQRRQILATLGLDRFARDALDVDGYARALRTAEAAQGAARGDFTGEPDPEVGEVLDRAGERDPAPPSGLTPPDGRDASSPPGHSSSAGGTPAGGADVPIQPRAPGSATSRGVAGPNPAPPEGADR